MSKTVVVTGGAGYIGSHTVLQLLLHTDFSVVVIDNLSNSSKKSLSRIAALTGKPIAFYQVDILDSTALDIIFKRHSPWAVMHFAGLKSVGESSINPLDYYRINVSGTITLVETMLVNDCRNLVFSSSATVYGDPSYVPIPESAPLSATNPYGRTKLQVELLLNDISRANPTFNIAILRYFNPVGAHSSGEIGEDPRGVPHNLMPFLAQLAVGKREELLVYGADYDTRDGTGVRDYIHVVDLADGHLAALEKLKLNPGTVIYNLGRGEGFTVLEMVQEMGRVAGKKLMYRMVGRRTGDVRDLTADASKAEVELGWRASKGLEEMCQDLWRWQSGNPNGYDDPSQKSPCVNGFCRDIERTELEKGLVVEVMVGDEELTTKVFNGLTTRKENGVVN